MANLLSEDELERLEGSVASVPDTIPEEVVARAKELSQPQARDVGTEDKLKFLAYMVEGRQFEKTYDLFDGSLKVSFTTISSAADHDLVVQTKEAGGDKGLYTRKLFAASLSGVHPAPPGLTYDNPDRTLDGLMLLGKERYDLLFSTFKRFRELVRELLQKAESPDFWRAPS